VSGIGPGFGFNEEEVHEQVEEAMWQDHQEFALKLLAYVFSVDPAEVEVDSEFSISRGERVTTQTKQEAVERIKYVLKTQGRTGALYALVGNLKALFPEEEEHKLLLFVEVSEADHFLELDEPLVALLRGCSFLEKVLGERVESSSDLAPLIQEAYENDVISEEEEQLAQFVRKCRNDAGHNFWLETEYSYVIHEHGAIALITLLDSLLRSWYRVRWNLVTPRLSVERCLRVVKEEFWFEWSEGEVRDWTDAELNPTYDRTN
jgi:hypothetical protein